MVKGQITLRKRGEAIILDHLGQFQRFLLNGRGPFVISQCVMGQAKMD